MHKHYWRPQHGFSALFRLTAYTVGLTVFEMDSEIKQCIFLSFFQLT